MKTISPAHRKRFQAHNQSFPSCIAKTTVQFILQTSISDGQQQHCDFMSVSDWYCNMRINIRINIFTLKQKPKSPKDIFYLKEGQASEITTPQNKQKKWPVLVSIWIFFSPILSGCKQFFSKERLEQTL